MFNIYLIKQNVLKKWNVLAYFARNKIYKRYSSSNTIGINTNVVKDVILYKYDNPRFFKNLNIFAVCQFGFWGYLSYFAFTTLRDAPVEIKEDTPWWRSVNLGENKYRNAITIFCFLIGNTYLYF